jgi:hypothetical protein
MMTVKPKGSWVIYKQVIVAMSSGIILPDGTKDSDLCKNIVVAIGDKVTRVSVGEEIILKPKVAMALNFPERNVEKDLRIVEEDNIIASLIEI